MNYIFGRLKASWSFGAGLKVVESTNYTGKTKLITKLKRKTTTRKCHCGRSMPKEVTFLGRYDKKNLDDEAKTSCIYEADNKIYIWYREAIVKHGWEGLNLGCSKRCTFLLLTKPANAEIIVKPVFKFVPEGGQKYELTIPWMNPDRWPL